MQPLIRLTQKQFDEATSLLQKDDKGYFLEFSMSTDRTDEYETPLQLLQLCEKIQTICRVLNVDIKDLNHFDYDYEGSDHEMVNKKLYFLTHSKFKEGYILNENEVIKEYNYDEHIAMVMDKNNPEKVRMMNCFNQSVYNYIIV